MRSIKQYPFRVRKKNKTRGRPSKEELIVSALLSHEMERNKVAINKAIFDCLMFGQGSWFYEPER